MAANEPKQALKDRVASEVRDYERGRDIYARRKFHDYEANTQGEKAIMKAVGQNEKKVSIPRAGEWVVKAPLKVKAGKKWNKNMRKSLDRSGVGSVDGSGRVSPTRSRPFPSPGGGGGGASGSNDSTMLQMNGSADTELMASDFRSQSISDISRLQTENVLQRRAASAMPAPVPLAMPGERELTTSLLSPEADQVFATTSLRDIVRSTKRSASVAKEAIGGSTPLPSEAFERLATDMPKMEALQQSVDAEASHVFDGAVLDEGPQPVDTTIPDVYGAQSPIRRRVARVQQSSAATPSFFPLCKFDDSDLEKRGVGGVSTAVVRHCLPSCFH
eukprot:SAG22_NODE_2864_length_2143_cov_66.695205_1_plen_331_part_00